MIPEEEPIEKNDALLQRFSWLIALFLLLLTAIPLDQIAFETMTSELNPTMWWWSNFFMFAYFPVISTVAPIAYWLFCQWRYGNIRGMTEFTTIIVAGSFVIVGITWVYAFIGGMLTWLGPA